MKFWKRFGAIFALSLVPMLTQPIVAASANGSDLQPSDLAIILPREPVGLSAPQNPKLFPQAWYAAVVSSFHSSSVGTALEEENTWADWQLVGLRVVPCSPMGKSPKDQIQVWCWPEVRLVWQPLVPWSAVPVEPKFFADDRAIHALYDVQPDAFLPAAQATEAKSLLQMIQSALNKRELPQLSPEQMTRFVSARNQVSAALISDARNLRQAPAMNSIEPRAEFARGHDARPFVRLLQGFLLKYALPNAATHLTAFSLPAGRDPATLDEWVFVKFDMKAGNPTQVPINLLSAETGREILQLGKSPVGSMRRDDPSIYDAISAGSLPEVEKNVMLWADPAPYAHLADREQILVPNTTCASCHKLQKDRFNFHAMSYLGRDALEISPRVKRDVQLDLKWIQENLAR